MSEKDAKNSGKQSSLTVWQVISSVLAAAFGVQKSKNRERDFNQGSISTFVIVGLVFTVAFVLIIVTIVNLVLYFVR